MTVIETRNSTLADLAALLKDQQARKLDVVANAAAITCSDGNLVIDGCGELVPDAEVGLRVGPGTFRPTEVCDEGISEKLKIPLPYIRRMRAERIDLFDANVNGWLHGDNDVSPTIGGPGPDPRSFLVRCFAADNDAGIARALLSDKFKTMDHLDTLGAVIDGARQARTNIEISGCDLSERRMYVRFVAPEVRIYAPELLANYRSPYSGLSGADLPVISAGLVASNSETGNGAAVLAPRMEVEICKNGMTRKVDAIRAVHLGGKMEEGIVEWSSDTIHKAIELITARTRDAVTTFLNVEYMQRVVDEMMQSATTKVTKVESTFKILAKKLSYDQETLDGILDAFIRGGDVTAGGVFHAVTAYAGQVSNPDDAFELECSAWTAMELAAVAA